MNGQPEIEPAPTRARSACPLDCPDACSLEVELVDGRVGRLHGTSVNPATADFICGKVRRFAAHHNGPERLLFPAVRDGRKGEGRFRRVSWDEALHLVADRLVETARVSGGSAILPFYYGGSNGALTQNSTDARFFRRLGACRLLRTVCASATSRAAAGLYGRMPGVAYGDYESARLIVIWGANPSASGIHLVPSLQRARERGATLVVIDPRRTPLAHQADLHLPVRPGTDLPVALSLIRFLFESGRADGAFLERHASGAEELRRRAESWTFERAAAVAGVPTADLQGLAGLYADTRPAVIRCGWGLERNRNGGSATAAILALPAVAGHFGVRGGGYTMSNSAASNLAAACDDPEPDSRVVNMNHLGSVLAETGPGRIAALFVYNANPLMTIPDQNAVRRGLEREDLFTVVNDAVMTDTARYADVLLPATTFLEHHELSRGYGAYSLQYARPVVAPAGEARPNYELFAELGRLAGLARPGDVELPRDLALQALRAFPDPAAALARLEAGESLPPPVGRAPVQFVDVFPQTPSGRIELAPAELESEAPAGLYAWQPDPGTSDYPLALISPALAQTISSTFGQLLKGPAAIELHPVDAQSRGLTDGRRVRVFNALGEVRCRLRVNPDLRPGVALLPKGLWARHTENGATACALAPDSLSDLGAGACFNDARVEVVAID